MLEGVSPGNPGRARKDSHRKEHLSRGHSKLKAGSQADVGWTEHCWSDMRRCESESYPGSISLPGLEALSGCAMVNFMYHLDWALGCPDTWSNVPLAVSVSPFLDDRSIAMGRPSQIVSLSRMSGPHSIS